MEADPQVLIPAAQSAMGLQGNHEGYLKSMLGVQDELAAHVQSPGAGRSMNSAMSEAHMAGKSLGQSLQEIIQALHDTGINIDVTDMDNAARVNNATSFGTDGVDSVAGDSMSAQGDVNLNWK